MVLFATYNSPFGFMEIGYEDGVIVSVRSVDKPLHHDPCSLSDLADSQLQEYFSGRRKVFDLPIRVNGTAFQKAVWNCVRHIPYGQTRTYGQIAAAVGKPRSSRAVGMANHRNPLPILIPCHRVIGSGGKLTGYAGGLAAKEFLLTLEESSRL